MADTSPALEGTPMDEATDRPDSPKDATFGSSLRPDLPEGTPGGEIGMPKIAPPVESGVGGPCSNCSCGLGPLASRITHDVICKPCGPGREPGYCSCAFSRPPVQAAAARAMVEKLGLEKPVSQQPCSADNPCGNCSCIFTLGQYKGMEPERWYKHVQ